MATYNQYKFLLEEIFEKLLLIVLARHDVDKLGVLAVAIDLIVEHDLVKHEVVFMDLFSILLRRLIVFHLVVELHDALLVCLVDLGPRRLHDLT